MITGLYAGILALIFIGLSFNVILRRLKNGVGLGDGDNHTLTKAIRVHANFAEHVPFAIILIMVLDFTAFNTMGLHILGCALVFCRIIHAYGLMKTSVASKERAIGTIGTYLIMAASALILIIQYVIA